MGLFTGSSTEAAPAAPLAQVQAIQQEIGLELAKANATELVNKLTENCFAACFAQPQALVTAGQETCTNQCVEKYMRAWNVVSKAYVARIQQQ